METYINGSFNVENNFNTVGLYPRRVCLAVSTMKETDFVRVLGWDERYTTKEESVLAETVQSKGVVVLREEKNCNFVVIWVPPRGADASAVNVKVQQVRSALRSYCDTCEMQLCALHLHDGNQLAISRGPCRRGSTRFSVTRTLSDSQLILMRSVWVPLFTAQWRNGSCLLRWIQWE